MTAALLYPSLPISPLEKKFTPVAVPISGNCYMEEIDYVDFIDLSDGKIYLIQGSEKSPLDALFNKAIGESLSEWVHTKRVKSIKGSLIEGVDCYTRVLELSNSGKAIRPLAVHEMDHFYRGCSSSLGLSSLFRCNKEVKTLPLTINFKEGVLNYGDHWRPLIKNSKLPHYILEMVSPRHPSYLDLLYSNSKIFDKSLYDNASTQIPIPKKRLDEFYKFILDNQEVIKKKLEEKEIYFINLTTDPLDPKYGLINKTAHKIEIFILNNPSVYSLSSYKEYGLEKISDEASFFLIQKAQKNSRLSVPFFNPTVSVFLKEGGKYALYKLTDWQSLFEVLSTETVLPIASDPLLASSCVLLPSDSLDPGIVALVRALIVLHEGGAELKSVSIENLCCKVRDISDLKYKILLSEAIPFIDGVKNIKELAVLLYNLWVLYKVDANLSSFIEVTDITADLEKEIIDRCQLLKTNVSLARDHKKFTFIQKLLKKELSLTAFLKEFEDYLPKKYV